jgi:pyruvate,water dikinase
MSILDTIRGFFHSQGKMEKKQRKEEEIRKVFKARCGHFKALLSANKQALSSMASLEEALKGERLFSMSFVRATCITIFTNVFNMVRHLNALSGNKAYEELFDRIRVVQQSVAEIISPRPGFRPGLWSCLWSR